MTDATELTAVILCGGQGTRMGSLTQEMPKSLVEVHGRPILWYIIGRLYLAGFRRFVLPVGYLGVQIAGYVNATFGHLDCDIICVDTGPDTPIGQRLTRVRDHLPDDGSFLLTNGDALMDFDLPAMIAHHENSVAAVTFATVPTISKYGLVLRDGDRITGFERESHVSGYVVETPSGIAMGYVYSGICLLRTTALTRIDLVSSRNFEAELFSQLINDGAIANFEIAGFWHAIDTPKDLAAVTSGTGEDPQFSESVRSLRATLEAKLLRV